MPNISLLSIGSGNAPWGTYCYRCGHWSAPGSRYCAWHQPWEAADPEIRAWRIAHGFTAADYPAPETKAVQP